MAYTNIGWKNGSSGGTPLNADNLNHIEAGLKEIEKNLNQTSVNSTTALLKSNQAVETSQQAMERVASIDPKIEFVKQKADEAQASANQSKQYADEAKTYLDDATTEADRAKSEADRASAIVGIDIATTEKAGIVKASDSVTVDPDGKMHAKTDSTVLSRIGTLENGITEVQNNVNTVGSFALSNRVMISDTWQNRGYSKGEYAIYNNQLYVCILAHASAIVPTNSTYWKATWVANELIPKESYGNLQNKVSTYFRQDYSYLHKIGNIVLFQIDIDFQNLNSDFYYVFVTIANMPSEFIPKDSVYLRCTDINGKSAQFNISTSGEFRLNTNQIEFVGGRFQMMYIV